MNTTFDLIWQFLAANGLTTSLLGLTALLVVAWVLVDFCEEHFVS